MWRVLGFAAAWTVMEVGQVLALQEGRRVTLRQADGYRVASIRFLHLNKKPIKNSTLRSAMQTRAGEPLQRRFLRNDLTVIENLYRGKGFMGAKVVGKTLELDDERKLHIAIKIDSGGKWIVEAVRLALADSVLAGSLRKVLSTGPGKLFLYAKVLQDERALQTLLNSQGYAHARVRNHLELDSRSRTARISYEVDPGPKLYFGAVRIIGVKGNAERELLTNPALVRRQLTFDEGDLYDPEHLRQSSSNLARTDLFRSIVLSTPASALQDSLQSVEIRLEEKKYVHLGAQFSLQNTDSRVAANVQHGNWLGRGGRLGFDASLGQPLQGGKAFLTERNVFESGADLTVAAGLTEEWGQTLVGADPGDSLQFELLTANDSILEGLLLFAGEEGASAYILASSYDFRSIERLWNFDSTLYRAWEPGGDLTYQLHFSVAWAQSRSRPTGANVTYNPRDESGGEGFGDDGLFADDDPFGEDEAQEEAAADGEELAPGEPGEEDSFVDYSLGRIPLDRTWRRILAEESSTINLTAGFERDTRDNQIAPTRGSFLRLTGLYAIQVGRRATRVLDGDFEARYYRPWGRYLVWAQGLRLVQVASLRQDRALPRSYWKEFGGEGSVRGVERDGIQAVGGGRAGINLRSEVRLYWQELGVVAFWDRAGVWRHNAEVDLGKMVDGYGMGLRYTMGIPFRFDLGSSRGFKDKRYYFSIGQAF